MKILMVFGFVCFISSNIYSASPCSDTIPERKVYKISQQQFLERYGTDDTTRAIINYYFLRYKKATKRLIPYSLIIIGSGILYATSVVNGAAGVVLVWGSITIGAMLIFGTLLLSSCADLLKFSRKKLLKILDNYSSGRGIPSNLKKNLYKRHRY